MFMKKYKNKMEYQKGLHSFGSFPVKHNIPNQKVTEKQSTKVEWDGNLNNY